MTTASDNIIMK